MLNDFVGGAIDVKLIAEQGRLYVEYSTDGKVFSSCITGKAYGALKLNGYFGITSGNPKF